jgi:hypothetical protein
MTHSYYNTTDHLTGIMLEFGKYTLKYKPPKGAAETKVKMEISSEVAIPELLVFFEDFMRAAGYIIDGKRLSLEREAPDFSDVPEKWSTAASPSLWGPVDWDWTTGNIEIKE